MSPSSLTRPTARDGASCRGPTETMQILAAALAVQVYHALSAASRIPFGEWDLPQTSRNNTGTAGERT